MFHCNQNIFRSPPPSWSRLIHHGAILRNKGVLASPRNNFRSFIEKFCHDFKCDGRKVKIAHFDKESSKKEERTSIQGLVRRKFNCHCDTNHSYLVTVTSYSPQSFVSLFTKKISNIRFKNAK